MTILSILRAKYMDRQIEHRNLLESGCMCLTKFLKLQYFALMCSIAIIGKIAAYCLLL